MWEYFDDTASGVFPDAVVDEGSSLLLDLSTLLGPDNLAGARVRVQHIPSGASEDAASVFETGVNRVRTSLLGQSTPSIAAYEYRVSLDWHPLDVEDSTAGWTQDGAVQFDLPQSIEQNWAAPWPAYRALAAFPAHVHTTQSR